MRPLLHVNTGMAERMSGTVSTNVQLATQRISVF